MGNTFNKPNANFVSFKREFDISPYLEKCPADSVVVVIKVMAANKLDQADVLGYSCYGGRSDPIIRLSAKPPVEGVGEQSQRTSRVCRTLDPVWEPAEQFQFISVRGITRIVLSAISRGSKKVFLGDVLLNTDEISSSEFNRMTLPLTSPSTGKPAGEVVIAARAISLREAAGKQQHTVHEYERYRPVHGWGNSNNHLLPTDPGRYANANRTQFFASSEEAAAPVPEGWKVTQPWTTTGHELGGAWRYSVDFTSGKIYSEAGTGLYVRHRTWIREISITDDSKIPHQNVLSESSAACDHPHGQNPVNKSSIMLEPTGAEHVPASRDHSTEDRSAVETS